MASDNKHWSYYLTSIHGRELDHRQFSSFKRGKIGKGIKCGLKARGYALASIPICVVGNVPCFIVCVITAPFKLIGGLGYHMCILNKRKFKRSCGVAGRAFLYTLYQPYEILGRCVAVASPAVSTYVMRSGDIEQYFENLYN